MSQCSFTKPNGERCKLAAQGPQGVCWNHDPKNAAKRRKQASKAATAKADKEIREVKKEIRYLIGHVREEDFDVSKANAINRLYGTLLQYIIVERGIYREDDLAQRIRELGGK
jgi:deoxyribodipyrimidine photolyase-like uncharacterized protein